MNETTFSLEVRPNIPPRLERLHDLANNLLYSWERRVRGLFYRLDQPLWEACGHNPKLFLRRVSQEVLEQAAEDRAFMEDYNRTLSAFDTYLEESPTDHIASYLDPERDLVAYFCAEFGFHESLPIYSGGLGILAGDHCKAASDLCLPFVGVGLLYRQGYFDQTIDNQGRQVAHYHPTDFTTLAVRPCMGEDGGELRVAVELPGRTVLLRVWEAQAGRIRLYLLDSDLPENSEADDRSITYQLYGGGTETRIQQEICLGIGGVRALRALGLAPTVWHINEGHSAFQVVERCRELVAEGHAFDTALEAVAGGTVFTTHTPVPAGHDIFEREMMETYFAGTAEALGIDLARFLALGENAVRNGAFNMTALALRGSRFHNGVSRIHGRVASEMEAGIWPQIPPYENPLRYVTNGIHVPTFLARGWGNLFDIQLRQWRNEMLNEDFWQVLDELPDHRYWSLRQSLKTEMLEGVAARAEHQFRRNGLSAAMIKRITRHVRQTEGDMLVIGFARRFATYKRAPLIFTHLEQLKELLNDPERPALLIFAGKAHPRDEPGQAIIHHIHELSLDPDFIGKILLLEGYDMALARLLVTGVDVWLNNPEYPLEACGTSGQKAGVNGVINLSVLDGWWGEGYDGENGWAITPHEPGFDPHYRDHEEARDLLNILSEKVLPLYYDRGKQGYSTGWVRKSKASMRTTIPRFNAQRMVMDYVRGFYGPARDQNARFMADGLKAAKELAEWKARVLDCWDGVWMQRQDEAPAAIRHGESLPIRVKAHLNGLSPEDVTVECLVTTDPDGDDPEAMERFALTAAEVAEDGNHVFSLDLEPHLPGLQYYKLRIYPSHPACSHPFELGRMVWL
ncbi:alpha-glucan family phosphorylase [Alkalilimnicola ehrlichii]|uniref:alpha-glucan family phosphorylase n=1 Tax=Alkalilimnicola ehrlichii TaxID=351052 RepID=UPI003BA15623